MKNIHILPTDKPSNIVIATIDGKLKLNNNINDSVEYNGKNQHIYITNDEKPKGGDYAIATLNGNSEIVQLNQSTCIYYDFKIILTTDPSLAPNVQAIDDEFLQWFIKNPSCEIIEVEKAPYDGTKSIDKYWGGEYKITIPKEEPKQDLEKEMFELEQELDIPSSMRWHNSKPKQETLEEAAKRLYPLRNTFLERFKDLEQKIFIEGAKWQAERSYSEEDMIEFMQFIVSEEELENTSGVSVDTAKYFLNKFKNK